MDSRRTIHAGFAIGIFCAMACGVATLSAYAQSDLEQRTEDLRRQSDISREDRRVAPEGREIRTDAEGRQPVESSEALPDVILRAPLLREGAYLTDAIGRLVRDPEIGFWVFRVESQGPAPAAEFIMLPSARLEQMERIVESTTDDEIIFRVTGRIYVYRNWNYLLPLSAPHLEGYVARDEPQDEQTDEGGEDEPADASVLTGDRSAEEIMRSIRDEVPLARGLDPEPIASGGESPGEATTETTTEGEIIMLRRGDLVRGQRGEWRFVFAADASGLSDPPMIVMPCLLLERLEVETQRRAGTNESLLVTGEVATYKGQRYLIPTMYQFRAERTNLRN